MRSKHSIWMMLVVFVAALLIGALSAVGQANGGIKIPPPRDDAGMTDSQRDALYSAKEKAFEVRYEQWLSSLNLSSLNYDALPHVELLGLWEASQPTLSTAKGHAELIVVGRAVKFQPTAFSGSLITLRTESVIKGNLQPGGYLAVHQAGGLRPTSNWSGIEVADTPNEPIALPGHRIMVFLSKSHLGRWEIQSFSGWYALENGRVRSLKVNAFHDEVDGTAETDFVARVVSTKEAV